MIKINNAIFITSAQDISNCPDFGLSEIAFLGRSNVGKSSLINALTNKKGLAKLSSTPGKTRLINFFEVCFDDEIEPKKAIFVDLPGFGYAKVSKQMQNQWQKNLSEFIQNRPYIRVFVVLIDSRHFDLDIDKNLLDFLSEFLKADQKIIRIYTKSDKLNQSAKSALKKHDKNAILVSNLNNFGINTALQTIYEGVFK